MTQPMFEAELKPVNDRLAGHAKDGTKNLTQPLQDGTVYIVEESQSSVGKYDGKSGYAVAPLPVIESLKDFKEKADDRSF